MEKKLEQSLEQRNKFYAFMNNDNYGKVESSFQKGTLFLD